MTICDKSRLVAGRDRKAWRIHGLGGKGAAYVFESTEAVEIELAVAGWEIASDEHRTPDGRPVFEIKRI